VVATSTYQLRPRTLVHGPRPRKQTLTLSGVRSSVSGTVTVVHISGTAQRSRWRCGL